MKTSRSVAIGLLLFAILATTACGSRASDATPREEGCALLVGNYRAAVQVHQDALLEPLELKVEKMVFGKGRDGMGMTLEWESISSTEAESRRESTATDRSRTYWLESFASLWPRVADADLKLVAREIAVKQNVESNFVALKSICPEYDKQ